MWNCVNMVRDVSCLYVSSIVRKIAQRLLHYVTFIFLWTDVDAVQARLQNCKKRLLASSCLSVRPPARPPARSTSTSTGRIFMKLDIWVFFQTLRRKFKCHLTLTRRTSTLHDGMCVFMICRRTVLRIRNVSDRNCRENQNTHFVLSNFFPKIVPNMR
jgi:hypothetical protein